MPTILVKVPKGAFPADAKTKLTNNIIQAAMRAEQIPHDPKNLFVSWVLIEEIDAGMWTCGGVDFSGQMLTCFAFVNVPSGVLDASSRALYVKLMQEAFDGAKPVEDKRPVISSVILNDVVDGTWGGSGVIWSLAQLAKVAGFKHLQHLVDTEIAKV
jgi:phenylpyruvate tautomerase PptA (4-oxalocrotonate tautomerase family)